MLVRDGRLLVHMRTKLTPSANGVAPNGVDRPRLVRNGCVSVRGVEGGEVVSFGCMSI